MNRFLKPDYASNCFSNIPSTLTRLLTGQGASPIPLDPKFSRRYDSVILILVDAFGWRFFEKYCDSYPFLKRFTQEGSVLKLTSQFPSTTAAHITTLHTNLPVGQSGVFEWQYYEPSVDAMIMPLMFSFVGTRERETLRQAKADPKLIYPQSTFYDALNAQGIASYIFQHRDYTPSTYSEAIFRGATEVRRIHTWS
ncbi:MAG: alkaline phosphatase family protein, partial [Chloroflexota bacterium]